MRAFHPQKAGVLSLATLALLLAGVVPSSAGFVYKLDDGTSEGAYGRQGGGDLIWLNEFTADPANPLITSISVAFGGPSEAGGAAALDGLPVTVAIWADPDGNPADATLLNTGTGGVIANAGSDTFNDYGITPTLVAGTFLVGVEVTHDPGLFPASFDTDNPAHKSWFTGGAAGTGNLTNLGANQDPIQSLDTIEPGNWLVRANGEPTSAGVVPEPAGWVLFALGSLFLVGYRQRRPKYNPCASR
jgi:hypothetical protein